MFSGNATDHLSSTSKLLKECDRLKKAADVNSALHTRLDSVPQFRKLVDDVRVLADQVMPGEEHKDLRLAIEGVNRTRRSAPDDKRSRPTLNVEDL